MSLIVMRKKTMLPQKGICDTRAPLSEDVCFSAYYAAACWSSAGFDKKEQAQGLREEKSQKQEFLALSCSRERFPSYRDLLPQLCFKESVSTDGHFSSTI